MRRIVTLLVFTLLIHNALATTIVVGNCTPGDYEFNSLVDAFNEAEDHSDVQIIICGEQKLEWSETIHANDITLKGGRIGSDGEYVKIYGDDITIEDVNFENTRIKIIATGDVVLRNLSCSGGEYCADINADNDVLLENVHIKDEEAGIRISAADEANIWSVFPENVNTPVEVDTENVRKLYLNAIVQTIVQTVERIVEKNVPVKEVEYIVPPEVYQQIKNCEDTIATIQEKKRELENEIAELNNEIAELKKQKVYPNTWAIAASVLIGLVAGYLAGRI